MGELSESRLVPSRPFLSCGIDYAGSSLVKDGKFKNRMLIKACLCIFEITIRYTPEQNGVAERMNRTIIEKARCMILNSKLGKNFWTEAALTAVYLVNRSPTSALNGKLPAALWFEETPNLKKLRVFGCVAFLKIPKEIAGGKFDSRSKRCFMLGYCANGYRLWCPEERKIICGRDIVFDESRFQFEGTTSENWQDLTQESMAHEEQSTLHEEILQGQGELEEEEGIYSDAIEEEEIQIPQTPRRSTRQKVTPQYLLDYATMALSAESFVDDVPESYDDIQDREDKIHWNGAIQEEVRSMIENETFDRFIKELGFQRSEADRCLYVLLTESEKIFLLLYVDDIIIAGGNRTKVEDIKRALEKKFKMTDLGTLHSFLGINITRSDEGIILSQEAYLRKLLARFNMEDCNPVSTPMETRPEFQEEEESTEDKPRPYRELIGCLMYAMVATRPDLSATVNFFSRFQSNPTESLWKGLKRVLRYIKGTLNFGLFFIKVEASIVSCFVDADFGSGTDRKSTSGFLIQMHGNTVLWATKRQNSVALSSTEAEYVALATAAAELIWFQGLLRDLGLTWSGPLRIFEDNQFCIRLLHRPEHKRLKHVDVKFNFVRDLAEKKLIDVQYINTKEQVADILTKALPKDQHVKLRKKLCICEIEAN